MEPVSDRSNSQSHDGGLEPVEPGYRHALRVRLSIAWLVLLAASAIADTLLLSGTSFARVPTLLVALTALGSIVLLPDRIYRRLRYRLDDRILQVVRGWLFHTDTVVPLIRVQHIDVTRGPLDKLFGIASLVIHTAGTHNSVVVVPGLSPDRAAEIRDTIREHVRTDFD